MVDLRAYDELHSIRMVREMVRSWWKLEIAYADPSGYVLDHADGNIFPSGNEFCRVALHSKEGFRRCNESVKALRASKNKSVILRQCHLGFDLVAAPIHFDDELVGFLFTGGAVHDELKSSDRSQLLSKVKEFSSAHATAMDEAVGRIPKMSDAELAHLQTLIEYGAQEIMKVWHERDRKSSPAAARVEPSARFGDIVGASPKMIELFSLLEKIVKSEATVLVHGESGTGKELIARAIHYHGPRKKKPFVVQNCSAFNDNLLESALFGHVRGAFTGAVKEQKGLFEVADGGTFFLDEIGDMSPQLQVKLLRVLQEGTFTPVGATKPVKVDVRIVAASHKDLAKLVEKGEFREDLYYRVNVLRVSVPPLRERLEDLPMLTNFFLQKHNQGEGETLVLSQAILDAMCQYRWPGNIRELENEIERLNVLSVGCDEIPVDLLSPRITAALAKEGAKPAPAKARASTASGDKPVTLREMVEGVEAEVIHQGLIRTHWNKSQLAKELGISRSNLIQKCSYYGLDRKN